uniref:Uncharacterized protein n=1 Tax=Candidatus Kentrum eta TaxID=2126337 RepID=A0A450VG73_9GAMM|nr:MAG: hypothetical protein BECKH772A_GA0070896_1014410 [Candidatus Kentron sp. H]VFJ98925.1 MAG: hypothetical protein BECKH772B_GA0070898_1014610 [Candidatus Kentron sp. H]VFK03727.1 MAG: hypothetical protein BECKH772C_GA0070978_1014210 [Candidatus Kentron sp. H]
MRTPIAWIVGIATFLGLFELTNLLGDAIGVPVHIYLDEPVVIEHRFYDEETDIVSTSFGLAMTIICGMLASRVGWQFPRVRGVVTSVQGANSGFRPV